LFAPTNLIAGSKPLLHEAIEQAINTKGVAAATKQYADNFERDKHRYTVNQSALMALTQK
jgi:hypothetical protein